MARVLVTRRNWDELAKAAHYNARELAKLCRLSKRQLERTFQRIFQKTPQRWLDEQRLTVAQDLLRMGQPIKSVAYELGYKQSSHFCRQFKTHNHVTPSEFIQAEMSPII